MMRTKLERRLLAATLGVVMAGGVALLALGGSWASAKHRIKAWVPHPLQGAERLDATGARRVYPASAFRDGFRWDPVAFLLGPVDTETILEWPEHPTGRLVLRSNNLGLRADVPTRGAKRGLRVLVLGDSHTQGLVPNAETFSSGLEQRLREKHAAAEVLNAGVAFTGPGAAVGRLRHYIELQPDAVVAVLYLGNDFLEELVLGYELDGWHRPDLGEAYYGPLERARGVHAGAVYQGLNQAYRFRRFPFEAAPSLRRCVEAFEELAGECARREIVFQAVMLPTKADVEPGDTAEVLGRACALLELTAEDLGVHRRLGRRFAEALAARGIPCLDPEGAMRAAEGPLYWRRDHHLATAGHALLAEELFAVLAPRL